MVNAREISMKRQLPANSATALVDARAAQLLGVVASPWPSVFNRSR